MLVYGYDLGCDDEWHVAEVDQYGGLTVEWANRGDDDEDDEEGGGGFDFSAEATNRLLAAAGFTETDWKADGFFNRKRDAEARIGVEVVSHCSGIYPMWLLSAYQVTAARGYPKGLDLAELAGLVDTDGLDAKLAWAADALGLTPTGKPGWLLCSYWGE
jgi:hypothetical protein